MYLLITCCLIFFETQPSAFSYTKFSHNGLGSTTYTFNSDSSLMKRESGEQWKGSDRKIGRWSRKGVEWSLTDKEAIHLYRADTLQAVAMLIGIESLEEWDGIKTLIVKDIDNDRFLSTLSSFTESEKSQPGRKEKVIRKIKMNLIANRLLGKNILVEE